jgi:hypothetical protein
MQELAASLFAFATDLSTDSAVIMTVGMVAAHVPACPASFNTGFHLSAQ